MSVGLNAVEVGHVLPSQIQTLSLASTFGFGHSACVLPWQFWHVTLPAIKPVPPLPNSVIWPAKDLGFYQREGKHSTRADDWTVFMNFADRQWH